MDSQGYCAKYCTYSFIEYDTKEILDVVLIDKRETQLKSLNMEVEGFIRLLNSLIEAAIIIEEIVTEAHPQITSQMSGLNHITFFWKSNYYLYILKIY